MDGFVSQHVVSHPLAVEQGNQAIENDCSAHLVEASFALAPA
jgi:hypothetical protein